MGISPLELQGGISRLQDFAVTKHQDDTKVSVAQTTIVQREDKQAEEKAETVNRGDDVGNNNKKYDAKEKGNGEYSGDGGNKRKREDEASHDGRVFVKGMTSSFDIRI